MPAAIAQSIDEAASAPKEVSAEDAEKAQAYFAKGAQFYYQKEYAKAIVEFLNAYKYNPDAMILYNLAMAQARLGNFEEAYKAAARAQQMGGMSDDVAVRNDARLDAWQVAMRGEETARASAAKLEAERELIEQEPSVVEVEDVPLEDEAPLFSAWGWAGIGAGAVGLGLLGFAGYTELAMQDDMDAYEQAAHQGDAARYHSLGDDLERQQSMGQISLYAGAALTAVGVGLLTFDLLRDDARTSSARLQAAADGRGASVQFFYEFR